jgi:hypothetical protein
MTTRAAKKAPAGKVKAFSDQSKYDYPYHVYEATGKDFYAKLGIRKQTKNGKAKKLSDYEEYLLTKHFPAQEKRFLAEQKSAGAKRKGARRAAIIRAGLVDEVEDVNKDSDANDGNDSVKVFQRKAPSKVLLKTKDLCNGYF